jgi:hypothetical protein
MLADVTSTASYVSVCMSIREPFITAGTTGNPD